MTTRWGAFLLTVCLAVTGLVIFGWPRDEQVASWLPASKPLPVKQSTTTITNPPTDFESWEKAYQLAATPEERSALEPVGIELARARREQLGKLIETDPRAALERAVSYRVRRSLPPEVVALLEERVNATGFFGVLGTFPGGEEQPVHRHFDVGQRSYRAFVFGRRLAQKTTTKATLYGIAIDGKLAVAEDPVRVLEPEEAADRRLAGNQICPISGAASDSRGDEHAVEAAGQIVYLCSGGHIAALSEEILAQEVSSDLVAQSAWTTGTKQMLVINVKFADQASCPDTGSGLTNMMSAVNLFFTTNSFSQTDMISTVTPCYQLPQTVQWYTTNDTSGYYLNVLQEARAVAANPTSYPGNDGLPAYNYLSYSLEAVRYNGPGGFSGQAYVGSRGCWLKSSSAGVADHEFGHNYGVWHANYWNCTNDTVTGAGYHVEYGNSFDTMGAAGGGAQHFNANFKRQLDWLTDAELHVLNTTSTGGIFRVTALDHGGSKVAGAKYAIRVPSTTAQRDYWIDFRQMFPGNKWLTSGGVLKWGDLPASDGGSRLLDTTPGTADDKNDAGIVIGRTYSDSGRKTHITPIAKAGTSPEALDVVVNIGAFPGNQAPTVGLAASATNVATSAAVTFTASAIDPNVDPLAYNWDFGDRTFGSNTAVVTKSWSSAGYYVVRCVASDMKGGSGSAFVLIKVGSPATFNVSGIVLDQNNNPLSNVRIHNGLATTAANYRNTYTASNGKYVLANLPAGSYSVTAVQPSYGLTATFANPVAVGPDRTDMNFSASQTLYTISGQVTDSGIGGAGALVSDGTRIEPTDANGNYTLYNVPSGSYTLTATKAGSTFNPSGFSNPVTVDNAILTGRNFTTSTATYSISGKITGVSSTTPVTITDGYRTTTSSKQGNNNVYTLQSVPAGTWMLRAYTATQSFTPSGFSNPVTVSGTLNNRDFALDATQTYAISGIVSNAPATVTVTAGSATVTSDSRGGYYLDHLANGMCIVTPTLAGSTFLPATRNVTINSANVSNQNFTTMNTDPPPFIVTPAVSSSNPIAANSTSLSILGDDNNGEQYLLYTWSTTGAPPAAVTFFPNNANAAKNSSATFTKAGNYGLRVVVRDVSGGTATSIVNVVVNQTLTTIAIAPASSTVPQGNTQQFTATAKDQFANSLSSQPSFTWTTTGGGTVNSTGLFSATGAVGSYTVSAISGSKTGTASVAVSAALPTLSVVATDPLASEFGLNNGAFTISRTGSMTNSLTVKYALTGSASNGVDYTTLTGLAVIPVGTTNVIVGVISIPDALPEGPETAVLTILSDPAYTVGTSNSATVTLADLPMDDWRKQQFGSDADNATIPGDDDDPDGDGFSNLLEYALDLDPNTPNAIGQPTMALDNDRLTLTYTRRKAPTDVSYVVLVCGVMPDVWTSTGVTEEILADDGVFQSVKAIDPDTISGNTGRFIRLKVSRP